MTILNHDYNRTKVKRSEDMYTGLDAFFYSRFTGLKDFGFKSSIYKLANKISSNLERWEKLSNEELKDLLRKQKENFGSNQKDLDQNLFEALGAIQEAAFRTLSLRPYKVQLLGALALYKGSIIEMATGEGKTLTAALTSVLWGWTGKPTHVVTVNDYLAQRDAERHQPLYEFCELNVGVVLGDSNQKERQSNYAKNICYTTSKEILADFLRDRLVYKKMQNFTRRNLYTLNGPNPQLEKSVVMKGIHYAIIDEADSILIDEAVTPLIISQPQENKAFTEACKQVNAMMPQFEKDIHYETNEQYNEIEFLPKFKKIIDSDKDQMGGSIAGGKRRLVNLIRQALVAREFYTQGKHYVVQEDKLNIVDEFTGRIMYNRTWSQGLHQMIEAKENVKLTDPTDTVARLSFQNFFRLFHKLSGMTGTAKEAKPELLSSYNVPVIRIPQNKKNIRKQYWSRIFSNSDEKWNAVVQEIKTVHSKGRPILVGTRNITSSEELAARLDQEGLPYKLLNAKHHEEEAMIIELAGVKNNITIATNMAGRGTDITLLPEVCDLGGLHVIATEAHESRRIDRQLYGRSGRQGEPGSARLFASLDDELMNLVSGVLSKPIKFGIKLKIPGSRIAGQNLIQRAQKKAQKIALKRRRSVLKMDQWFSDSLSFSQDEIF